MVPRLMPFVIWSNLLHSPLTTERLQKAIVETSVIKKMHVSLNFTTQGIITTELIVGLINADTILLKVDIGSGATLRLCTVNGSVVDPALGDNSGTLLIPVPKSRSTESTLQLSYLLDGQPIQDGLRLDLPLPQIELPIDEMGILLCPPPQYSVDLKKPGLFQVAKAPNSIQLTRKDIKINWMNSDKRPIPSDAPPRIRELITALETYYIDNNSYAPNFSNLTTPIAHLPPGDDFWAGLAV